MESNVGYVASEDDFIWVFNGQPLLKPYSFSSAVFTEVSIADSWAAFHGCSGVLTQSPIDTGFFDWARARGVEHAQIDDPAPEVVEDWIDLPLRCYSYEAGYRTDACSVAPWRERLQRAPLRLDDSNAIWLFVGTGENKPPRRILFPSAAFRRLIDARRWIRKHRCAGTLTEYPLDEGVYDWAVHHGLFKPTQPKHFAAAFIESFSDAAQPHEHVDRDDD